MGKKVVQSEKECIVRLKECFRGNLYLKSKRCYNWKGLKQSVDISGRLSCRILICKLCLFFFLHCTAKQDLEKDFFFLLWVWDKEKILSPYEELNLRPLDSTLWCSTTEPQGIYGEQGPFWSSYMTCILNTSGISSVNIMMFCK